MKWSEIRDRKGIFVISRTLLEDCPDLVMKVMSKVIIFRAEFMFDKDAIEYHAVSPWFNEISLGFEAPYYTVETNGIDVMFW